METRDLKFWEVGAKSDKNALLADPALLWETAKEYFNYCVDNPIKPGKAEGGELFTPKVLIVTIEGLCLYMGCTPKWFREVKSGLVEKGELTDVEQELLDVINRIEQVIYLYKFNYAVAGLLNVRMIIRDLEQNEKKNVEKRIIKVRIAE